MKEVAKDLFDALSSGNRGALGRAITILESTLPEDHSTKLDLLASCELTHNESRRIAVTGAPGVGKSSLIEKLGLKWIEKGHRVAVLAIDPSSSRSGGSILGDKTRMPLLSRDPRAFIRPSPTSGVLGGVAQMTRETILLCEAAGYDRIIVETVGIGQSETGVASITDLVVFVTMSGSGDSLQGIKRGVLEIIDAVAVNKADGEYARAAKQFATELDSALHVLHGARATSPRVMLTSATTDQGIEELLDHMEETLALRTRNGILEKRRLEQREEWFRQATTFSIHRSIQSLPAVSSVFDDLSSQIQKGLMHPYAAADLLVKTLFKETEGGGD